MAKRRRTLTDLMPLRVTGADVRGPGLRGPTAMGALAAGATAFGAVALGRLAIGQATVVVESRPTPGAPPVPPAV